MKKLFLILIGFLLSLSFTALAGTYYWADSGGVVHLRGLTTSGLNELPITTNTYVTKNFRVGQGLTVYGDITNSTGTLRSQSIYQNNYQVLTTSCGAIVVTDVTFENLQNNGDVGSGNSQVAIGTHNHTGVYEPADATIMKEGEDISLLNNNSNYIDTTSVTFSNLQNNNGIGGGNNQVQYATNTVTAVSGSTPITVSTGLQPNISLDLNGVTSAYLDNDITVDSMTVNDSLNLYGKIYLGLTSQYLEYDPLNFRIQSSTDLYTNGKLEVNGNLWENGNIYLRTGYWDALMWMQNPTTLRGKLCVTPDFNWIFERNNVPWMTNYFDTVTINMDTVGNRSITDDSTNFEIDISTTVSIPQIKFSTFGRYIQDDPDGYNSLSISTNANVRGRLNINGKYNDVDAPLVIQALPNGNGVRIYSNTGNEYLYWYQDDTYSEMGSAGAAPNDITFSVGGSAQNFRISVSSVTIGNHGKEIIDDSTNYCLRISTTTSMDKVWFKNSIDTMTAPGKAGLMGRDSNYDVYMSTCSETWRRFKFADE